MTKKVNILLIIFIICLSIVLFTYSYAYFSNNNMKGIQTDSQVSSYTADSLTFENATTSVSFNGTSSVSTTYYSIATLVPNDKTNVSSNLTYYAYVYIPHNPYSFANDTTYTKQSISMKIYDPYGHEVKSVTGLTYSEWYGGFNLSTKEGLYLIQSDYPIASSNLNGGVSQKWKFVISMYYRSDETQDTTSIISPTILLSKTAQSFSGQVYYCAPGNYLSGYECKTCPSNYYCPGGNLTYNADADVGKNACSSLTPTNTYTLSAAGAKSESECYLVPSAGKYVAESKKAQVTCAAGYACSGNSNTKVYYGSTGGATVCSSGTYSAAGASSCTSCSTSVGIYSTGSTTPRSSTSSCYITTTAGKYIESAKASSQTTCPANSYCPSTNVNYGSTGKIIACETGKNSSAGSSTASDCVNNTYNISYTLNSGTAGSSAPPTCTYNKTCTISNPTRTNYYFAGWTVSSGLNTSTAMYGTTSSAVTTSWSSASTKVRATYFKNLTATNGGTVKLVANWTAGVDACTAEYGKSSHGHGTTDNYNPSYIYYNNYCYKFTSINTTSTSSGWNCGTRTSPAVQNGSSDSNIHCVVANCNNGGYALSVGAVNDSGKSFLIGSVYICDCYCRVGTIG